VVESHKPRRGQVFHSPWIDGAQLRPGVPQVVTLHDLVRSSGARSTCAPGCASVCVTWPWSARIASSCPTQAVADDVVEHLDVSPERIAVIGEAAHAAMRPRGDAEVAAVREKYALPPEYLVWVGGMERPDPRKRVGGAGRGAAGAAARARRTRPPVGA
jgi:hypothetical protein